MNVYPDPVRALPGDVEVPMCNLCGEAGVDEDGETCWECEREQERAELLRCDEDE